MSNFAEAAFEILGGDHLGGLVGVGGCEGVAQAEQATRDPTGGTHEPLDRGQVESVRLQVEDKTQSSDVIGVVVADPGPHLGRGEQAAGLVVADVAHRHPRLGRELLDREASLRHDVSQFFGSAISRVAAGLRLSLRTGRHLNLRIPSCM